MIRPALTAIVLGLPAAAAAQVVPVRTAEHDGFTRIVLDFERRPDWEIDPGARMISIDTDSRLAFDLSQVYRRIGDERVDQILQPGPGRLDILVNCDCAARTLELRNEGLVIDISPGPPPMPGALDGQPGTAGMADLALEGEPPETHRMADLRLEDGLLPGLLTGAAPPGWRPGPMALPSPPAAAATPQVRSAEAAPEATETPEMPETAPGGERETETPPAAPAATDRADTLREGIVEAMIESAERGVIELADTLPDLADAPAPERARRTPLLPALEPGSNILIETREDKDRRGYGGLGATAACPEGLTGGRGDWLSAIGPVEVDAPAAAQARADAIPLIAAGLGAEARAVLAPHRADPQIALLDELAAVADDGAPAPLTRSVADCGPLLSVFALIADPPLGPRRIASVVQGLESLSPGLKVQFGRRAIAALNAVNRSEHAEIVRNAVARQVPGLPEEALLPRDYGPGREIPTEEQAIRELADRTPEAADALHALIDAKRRAGETVPSTIIDQAAALIPELSEPDRIALSRAMIRAEIAQGSYQSAARRIDGLARTDPALAHTLELSLHDALIGIEDDGIFLRQAARFAGRRSAEEGQRMIMAERVLALHVPRLAGRFLADADRSAPAERLLRARIGIELTDWDAAGAALAGLDGPEASALRAEIAAGRSPEMPVVEAQPEPTGVGAESLSVIARSAALREKYEELLASRE